MAHLFAHLTVRAPIGNSLVTFLDPKKFADLTFRWRNYRSSFQLKAHLRIARAKSFACNSQ
ncbi:hypothetical protein P5673_015585 [Acropora cervicornis]|uniref:Uncharacterized protein n=1 Tax=Acropora cervicornis TaxID=6130 RepID=A0AAD9QHU2_ACRCE|nr:hypothetical protein P5673_015585 [Acropora cervicornis]